MDKTPAMVMARVAKRDSKINSANANIAASQTRQSGRAAGELRQKISSRQRTHVPSASNAAQLTRKSGRCKCSSQALR